MEWCHILAVLLPSLTLASGENTESPYFSPGAIRAVISESENPDFVVFHSIIVNDADAENPALSVSCVDQFDAEYNPCDFFSLEPTEEYPSLNEWRGRLTLNQSLDYETQDIYQVVIEATDGVHTVSQTYTVEVLNGQDMPPVFTGSMTVTVDENQEEDVPVLQVVAVDGDGDPDRQIRYRLANNPGGYFSLNPISGQFSFLQQPDREDNIFSAGSISVNVEALEVLDGGVLGDNEQNKATGTITVNIVDVNDNGPVFLPSNQYEVRIEERMPNGAALSRLNIKVEDFDQSPNADFRLELQDHTDIFELRPTEGSGSVAVSIYMKNNSLVDYESPIKEYTLQILATETNTVELHQAEGYVHIEVLDSNDNPPVFPQESYSISISESASAGAHVITIAATDEDSEVYGREGIRYRLSGEGANHFECDRYTGSISVIALARCVTPGTSPCLDAEVKNVYDLTMRARDSFDEGHITTVPLVITITDVNDNQPEMELPEYVSYITEGETETDPEIVVRAVDGDRPDGPFGVVSYFIISGDPRGVWTIDPNTGVVSANVPVSYPLPLGYYLFTVEARDPDFVDVTTVKIFVEDINNHPPIFTQGGRYEQYIPENTPPGAVVETVTANDDDPAVTPNGHILYRISEGDRGKFVINETTGEISVAPRTTFDYNLENRYTMTVIASDQGSPQRTDTAEVIINILDFNNKDPYFQPTTVRTDVREDAPLNEPVLTMTAFDLDTDANIVYTIVEPILAWDGRNSEILNNPYKDWFAIDPDTGVVTVNGDLNRDLVIRWSATVKVEDTNGQDQTALGSFVITILDVNERGPVFGPPWTEDDPYVDISVREGQDPPSYVTTITATDPSDLVDKYILLSNPGGFFQINNQTGVITIAKPLDYEEQQTTRFVVVAVDDGQPPLSATATVNVNIQNVNDETPRFVKLSYETSLMENTPAGGSVITVRATDDDLGDYGVVKYQLEDPDNNFVINPNTGVISVAIGANLDRETTQTIIITARAYDSPADESVRKYTSVPVYITLLDQDEFPPRFGEQSYTTTILVSSPVDTSVVQLTATDADASEPDFKYEIISTGSFTELFYIDEDTGLITTTEELNDEEGIYNLRVQVTNGDKSDQTVVRVTIVQQSNNKPEWIFPNPSNSTVQIQEGIQPGVATTVFADDEDIGNKGIVDYSIKEEGRLVNQTAEFQINPTTGVISALVVFDRELQDTYILQLVAKDRGAPPSAAEERLVISILDINDNKPKFPSFQNCCSRPKEIHLLELAAVSNRVVTVTAEDRDTGASAIIYYNIIDGNEEGTFRLDPNTGEIFLNKSLDHERTTLYNLTIEASNPTTPTPNMQCPDGCDPSILKLFIFVTDKNEHPPVFDKELFNACVSENAVLGKSVTTVMAYDPDKGLSAGMIYYLTDLSLPPDPNLAYPADTFVIGRTSGTVYTNMIMQRYTDLYFLMAVMANDTEFEGRASLRIWVTPPSKEVIVTVAEEKSYVDNNLDAVVESISTAMGNDIVCVSSVRHHFLIDSDGNDRVDGTRTDLHLHVIDKNRLVIHDPEYVEKTLEGSGFHGTGVLAAVGAWDGFIRDPVLIAIIIVVVLLFLALLLLCLLCCCLKWCQTHKKKYVESPMVLNAGTINPLWYTGPKGVEEQELSMSVPEAGAKLQAAPGFINAAFDETDDVFMNNKMSNGYAASHEEVQETSLMDSAAPHIEANLVGGESSSMAASNFMVNTGGSMLGMAGGAGAGSTMGGGSTMLGTMSRAIQTDEQVGTLNTSMEFLPPASPSRIGATLSHSDLNWQGTYGSGLDYDTDYVGDARNIGIQTYSSSQAYNLHSPSYAYHEEASYVPEPEAGNVDGFYQGEIHLGSLPYPRGASQSTTTMGSLPGTRGASQSATSMQTHTMSSQPAAPAPQWKQQQQQQHQETMYTETTEHRTNYHDGDIEYINF